MTTIELELSGTPTPKGRPRFTSNGRTYTDAKTKAAEARILSAWLLVARGRRPHDGPVSVELVATFEPAASWTKTRRASALAGELPHLSRPDLDNLLKIIDGLNGYAWLDDSQIVHMAARKQYGPTSSTLLRITFHHQLGAPENASNV